MTRTPTIYDAMPLRVLEELERLEVEIHAREQQGAHLIFGAEVDRRKMAEIVEGWRARAETEGLDNLIEQRQADDLKEWMRPIGARA
jgi:hypothetical protein